jgi:methylenetetrahydrofolate--tRNA-(uracil-5-)-methyltransferase
MRSLEIAVGLLKEELTALRILGYASGRCDNGFRRAVLAVDRSAFSEWLTQAIRTDPLIEVIDEEVTEIPDGFVILATGPLTATLFSRRYAKKNRIGHPLFL